MANPNINWAECECYIGPSHRLPITHEEYSVFGWIKWTAIPGVVRGHLRALDCPHPLKNNQKVLFATDSFSVVLERE